MNFINKLLGYTLDRLFVECVQLQIMVLDMQTIRFVLSQIHL